MTNDQFDALAELMRLRQSSSREGARLVFVEGKSQSEAARQCGLSPQNINDRVRSIRHALTLIEVISRV